MRGRPTDGLLLVDKPAGMTSHDVVALARRALGERRIGHAGTLDPFATGLLVLLVGRATRLLPFIDGEPKVYEAAIRFGAETDTDDLTGAVTRTAAVPDESAVRAALPALTGRIDQVPSAYSAKKVAGERAYAAARRGDAPELAAVPITVHAWELRGWRESELDALVTVSGGTYVRALARDLGRLTGGAAHLASLRRLRSGPFDVRDAMPALSLRDAAPPLRPALDAIAALPVEPLDADALRDVLHGRPVPARRGGERAALVDDAGALVAVAERQAGAWQPRVVLRDA